MVEVVVPVGNPWVLLACIRMFVACDGKFVVRDYGKVGLGNRFFLSVSSASMMKAWKSSKPGANGKFATLFNEMDHG